VRPGDQVIAATPPSPRGVPAAALASAVVGRGVAVEAIDDVARAVATAWRDAEAAGEGDLVVVTGSLYTVGAARTACRGLGLLT
ncbi:MAG: glutamate ligase domain-containing protein, partial [Acidimicrobiales bacterium]